MSAKRGRVRVWAGEGRVLRDGGSERVRGGARGRGGRAGAGARVCGSVQQGRGMGDAPQPGDAWRAAERGDHARATGRVGGYITARGRARRGRGTARGCAPASAERYPPSPLDSRRSRWASFGLREARMGADGRWLGGRRRRQSRGGDTGDYMPSGCAGRLALLLSGRQGCAAARIEIGSTGPRTRTVLLVIGLRCVGDWSWVDM